MVKIVDILVPFSMVLSTVVGQSAVTPCDDDPGPDCNPITSENFANVASKALIYPPPTSTIYNGIVYDTVYYWNPEPDHELLHSFAIYTASGATGDCADAVLFNNGVPVNFVNDFRSGAVVCYAPISEQFERDDLLNPTDVYILLKNTFAVGDEFFIDRDYSTPIVPKADAVFYLYELDTTSLSTNADGAVVTLDVNELTYTSADFNGVGTCNDMDTIMATIDIGPCTLTLDSSDSANGIYTYNYPKTQYEACADTINGVGNILTYSSTITLPTDNGNDCYYFRPGDHQQVINVEFDNSNINGTVSLDASDLSVQILSYDIERCLPVQNYILPQHKAIFTLNITTGGDTNPTISSVPYLDTVGNILTVSDQVCDIHSSGSGVECQYTLTSTDCRPSYVNDDNNCIVDRFTENSIYNFDVTIGTDIVTVGGTSADNVFQTGLENARFDASKCDAPANIVIENVTDTYVGTIDVRNLPSPDWSVPEDVKMYEEIIVQMEIDSNAVSFAELQIQSITVNIEDVNDLGTIIAQRVFNKGDKLALGQYDFSGYYDDAHFCTWHDSSDNTCSPYYDGARINPFYTNTLSSRINDVCQTAVDNTIKDYFSFNPSNWFKTLSLPELKVSFDIISTIEYCDGRSNSRRLQGSDDSTTVSYVQYDISRNVQTILYTGDTEAPTNATSDEHDAKDLNTGLIVGATVGGVIFVFFLLLIIKYKKGAYSSVE